MRYSSYWTSDVCSLLLPPSATVFRSPIPQSHCNHQHQAFLSHAAGPRLAHHSGQTQEPAARQQAHASTSQRYLSPQPKQSICYNEHCYKDFVLKFDLLLKSAMVFTSTCNVQSTSKKLLWSIIHPIYYLFLSTLQNEIKLIKPSPLHNA